MQLARTLRTAGLDVFPCRADKSPATDGDWKVAARSPYEAHHWPSGLVGVPVPPGVLILDLDTYKGITRADVERLVGAPLDWEAARIQTTLNGGEHYAFRVDWDARQGSNIDKLAGLDLRAAGRGYVCTGEGYTPSGFGLFALANPSALPSLPDQARAVFEQVERTAPERDPSTAPVTDDQVVSALRHVDPGAGRSDWLRIAYGLKNHYQDNQDEGALVFAAWSAGDYWPDGCPANYSPEDIDVQWSSLKPDGSGHDVTIGTIFYEAVKGGWSPPATINTAGAFGAGAADNAAFDDLVDAITQGGCNPKRTASLLDQVRTLGGNPLQVATLLALLTRELKDAGLLTKPIREQLDGLAGVAAPPRAAGMYGKNHMENAAQFMARNYPGDTLVRSDQIWYKYNGRAWEERSDDDVKHEVTRDMAASLPQWPAITGTYSTLASLQTFGGTRINRTPDHLILFQNGVLDLFTGRLLPHSPTLFTTNLLPYAHDPAAECPHWSHFLQSTFEGDGERIALLQEWLGYMLSSSYAHHKILLMLGPQRAGKSTIGHVLARLVGHQNFTGASLEGFGNDATLESFVTKTVAFSGDTASTISAFNRSSVIERIKKLSGGDEINFNRKYKSAVSVRLPTRLTLSANSVPRLFDDSGALAGRMLLLVFNKSWKDKEDHTLESKLEAEIEGISAWALLGLRRLNSVGRFTVPLIGAEESEDLLTAYSPLMEFVNAHCKTGLGEGATTFSDEIFDAYVAWGVQHGGEFMLTRRKFINTFQDVIRGQGCRYGVHRRGDKTGRGFRGLALTGAAPGTASAFTPTLVKP